MLDKFIITITEEIQAVIYTLLQIYALNIIAYNYKNNVTQKVVFLEK